MLHSPRAMRCSNIWTIEKGYDDLDVEQNFLCPRLRFGPTPMPSRPTPNISFGSKNVRPSLRRPRGSRTSPPRARFACSWLRCSTCRSPRFPTYFWCLKCCALARRVCPRPGLTTEIYNQVQAAATWELVALYNNSLVHTLTSGQILAEWVSIFRAS